MTHKRLPSSVLFAFIMACWFVSDDIVATSFSYSWPIKELARSNDDQIVLHKRNGGTLRKVNTQQLRYLYAVKTSFS